MHKVTSILIFLIGCALLACLMLAPHRCETHPTFMLKGTLADCAYVVASPN